jgi:hypothetical protein
LLPALPVVLSVSPGVQSLLLFIAFPGLETPVADTTRLLAGPVANPANLAMRGLCFHAAAIDAVHNARASASAANFIYETDATRLLAGPVANPANLAMRGLCSLAATIYAVHFAAATTSAAFFK